MHIGRLAATMDEAITEMGPVSRTKTHSRGPTLAELSCGTSSTRVVRTGPDLNPAPRCPNSIHNR